MSRTKIASHYYNLGRQQAARDILGGRTKTAAPSAKELRQLAALGGAGLLGAGAGVAGANYKAVGAGLEEALARAAMTGRALTDSDLYRSLGQTLTDTETYKAIGRKALDLGNEGLSRAAMTGRALTDPAVFRMALQDATGASKAGIGSYEQYLRAAKGDEDLAASLMLNAAKDGFLP